MRKLKPLLWVLGGIALLSVFAGMGTLVFWLVNKDNAYIPLAGAIVSGTATLTGVAIGALVLRFNYRSQANPLRLELYKKRTDALVTIYEKIAPLRFMYLKYIRFTALGCKMTPGLRNDMNDKLEEIKLLQRKYDLILPEDIITVLAVLTGSFQQHTHSIVTFGMKHARTSDSRTKMHQVYSEFVNRCRKHIGTKEISDGIIELLGVDIPPFEEPTNPEDRMLKTTGKADVIRDVDHIGADKTVDRQERHKDQGA